MIKILIIKIKPQTKIFYLPLGLSFVILFDFSYLFRHKHSVGRVSRNVSRYLICDEIEIAITGNQQQVRHN